MKKIPSLLFLLVLMTACTATNPTDAPALPSITVAPVQLTNTQPEAISTSIPPGDIFTENGIALNVPVCHGLTQQQGEGPYYTPNTPQRNSFLEEGMQGTKLILVGYVLDQNCGPLVNAKLDFWQANASGEYDNAGYTLRGHQFTDSQGRYFLETILPGLYNSRPIEHIHVKIQPQGGAEVTSQLYFPQQPIEGLTVTLEERDGYLVGYFNFVVQK